MRALNRKLLRDLSHLRTQVGAVAMVVTCGIATFVALRSVYDSLLLTQRTYYALYRFADVFARLERAPEPVAEEIAEIAGVETVETRVVAEVTLDVPGLEEPATGRLVSIPEGRMPELNALYLRSGRMPEPGRDDEVLASDAFADANDLQTGDTVAAILNGRWRRLRITGVALSPEYVYEIRGVGELFPDNRLFGVLWMGRDALAAAFDLDGAFNDVTLSLSSEADTAAVLERLDRVLERYGGLGAFDREDQISHRFLSDEIAQNRVTSTIVPAIFMGVAAFLLNILLARLVGTQRDQIAVLKAFGYGDLAVGAHYLGFALVAVLIGAVLGIALGLWLGTALTGVYAEFYRFPVLRYVARPATVVLAIGINVAAALLGALAAVRRAVRLPPAEAMRPEPPARFRPGPLERLGMGRFFSPAARIVARNLERRPLRAALSLLGIALAVAILIVGRLFHDAVDYIADVQFRLVQREDVTVTFERPLSARVRYELERLPGVLESEPFRAVAVRLRHGHRSYRTALQGQEPTGRLRRVMDQERLEPVEIPPSGLVLTERLADLLAVRPGDVVTVEVLEAERPVRQLRVAATADELVGVSAYMAFDAVNRLMREEGVASGAFLAVDPLLRDTLYAELKRLPAVAGVSIRETALASFEKTIAESLAISTTVLIVFAVVIAFGIVYNGARISLSERGRELATLRVLGFYRSEVASILLGEQAVLTILAVPAGFLLGYAGAAAVIQAASSELYELPLIVTAGTYLFALGVVFAAALGSAWIVRRRLDRIDLIEVLKTRE